MSATNARLPASVAWLGLAAIPYATR